MAITKETILSQVECVKMDTWKVLQVRSQVRVMEDGVEIAKNNHRTTLNTLLMTSNKILEVLESVQNTKDK